jgi:hypothetical protein
MKKKTWSTTHYHVSWDLRDGGQRSITYPGIPIYRYLQSCDEFATIHFATKYVFASKHFTKKDFIPSRLKLIALFLTILWKLQRNLPCGIRQSLQTTSGSSNPIKLSFAKCYHVHVPRWWSSSSSGRGINPDWAIMILYVLQSLAPLKQSSTASQKQNAKNSEPGAKLI